MYRLILTFILINCFILGKCHTYLINNTFSNDKINNCFEYVQQFAEPYDTIFFEGTGKIYKSIVINKPLNIIGIDCQNFKNSVQGTKAMIESVTFGAGSKGSNLQNLFVRNEIQITESQISIEKCLLNNIYINSTIKPLFDIIISNNFFNSISRDQISISEIISKKSFPVKNINIQHNFINSKSVYCIYFSNQILGEICNNIINGIIYSCGTKNQNNLKEENCNKKYLTLSQ